MSPAELYALLQLRQQVFVVEQQCIYQDLDGLDLQAWHMRYVEDGETLACQRCLPPGASYPESSLGRVVVAPHSRGGSLGRELVRRGIEFNQRQWPQQDIYIGAQAYLRNFYSSLGFVAEGGLYLEDGIEHIHMRYAAGS
ncbi:GNAT family N-acetyltransferase [Kineobactrum salinum]|uniref:GNAT family N-acetyltransferase n=2 Tax=Kineobactrum salinum TaxID=2708301 RepID=A0A6C0U8C1_9GAMM|nr:GNAT family N-acetyltransferase [Kineobactrum salinum]